MSLNETLPPTTEEINNRVQQLAAQQRSKFGRYSRNWPEHFREIEDLVDQAINDTIAKVEKPEDVITTIKAQKEKLSLSSGITPPILGISQQLLAFGGAGVALTIGFIDKVKRFDPTVQKCLAVVGIFYSELIVLSLLVLILYMLQARFRYPSIYFEKIGNAWPFFYYATVTPVARSPLQSSRARFDSSVAYAKDFIRFAERVVKEDQRERLRVELQQYFLLMSYQGYVHQFAVRLARLFMYGFIGAVATAIIMFALVIGGQL